MSLDNPKLLIPVARTPHEMQKWSRKRKSEGKIIGCVPTMGALHDGHLSLIERSASECDETIVTIFVNPLQFGPNEDFEKYPRNEGNDLKLSMDAGASIAFCPTVESMYFEDRSTYVIEEELSKVMCGKSRPNHFKGVTTVVAKLFNACLPDFAYFGQKDYQQLLIIKRMVRDLDFPVEIIACPTVREPDGLAMSSRNKYLTPEQRKEALGLKRALDLAFNAFTFGERDARAIERNALSEIEKSDSLKVDYIECRDAETLAEIKYIERPAVLAMAVFIGTTRLIDNIILEPSKEGL